MGKIVVLGAKQKVQSGESIWMGSVFKDEQELDQGRERVKPDLDKKVWFPSHKWAQGRQEWE